MTRTFEARVLRWWLVGAAVVLAANGCFYDFEAPFEGAAGGAGDAGGAGPSGTSISTATGATTSHSSATHSAASSSSGGENCTNNVDDDGDGKIDCDDSMCAGVTSCVAAPPLGFHGPYLFAIADAGAGPATCPAGSTLLFAAHAGAVTADAATCNGCACDAAAGMTCGAPSATGSNDPGCSAGNEAMSMPPNGCATVIDEFYQSALLQPSVTAPGMCNASGGGVASIPPIAFQQDALVCETPLGGGCTQGVCAAIAPMSFELCYEINVDAACPPSAPVKTSVFEAVDDTRGCAPCGCGAPAVACNDSIDVYADFGCGTVTANVPADGVCHAAGVFYTWLYHPGTPTGTCAITGGAATGSATPSKVHTICCAQ